SLCRILLRAGVLRIRSLRHSEPLAELTDRKCLAEQRRSRRELHGAGERKHNGLYPGIADELYGDLDRLRIVAGDRHADLFALALRLALEIAVADWIEGAHQPGAGQIFLRSRTDTVRHRLLGDLAVPRRDRVARIDHDLAGELRGVFAPDLSQGRIGHRDEHDIAEGDCLAP